MICSDDTTPNPSRWEAKGLSTRPSAEHTDLHLVAFRKRLEEFELRLSHMIKEEHIKMSRDRDRGFSMNKSVGPLHGHPNSEGLDSPDQANLPKVESSRGPMGMHQAKPDEQQAKRFQQLGTAQGLTRRLIVLARQRPYEISNSFIEQELTRCGEWVWAEFKAMVTSDLEQCMMLIEENKNSLGDFLSHQSRTGHGHFSAYSFAHSKDSRILRSETEAVSGEMRKDVASHSQQDIDHTVSRADHSAINNPSFKKIKRKIGFERIATGLGKNEQHQPKHKSKPSQGLLPNTPYIRPEAENAREAIVRIKKKFESTQEAECSVEYLMTGPNTKTDEQLQVGAVNIGLDQAARLSTQPNAVVQLVEVNECQPKRLQTDCALTLWNDGNRIQQKLQYSQNAQKLQAKKKFLMWLESQNELEVMKEFDQSVGEATSIVGKQSLSVAVNSVSIKRALPKLSLPRPSQPLLPNPSQPQPAGGHGLPLARKHSNLRLNSSRSHHQDLSISRISNLNNNQNPGEQGGPNTGIKKVLVLHKDGGGKRKKKGRWTRMGEDRDWETRSCHGRVKGIDRIGGTGGMGEVPREMQREESAGDLGRWEDGVAKLGRGRSFGGYGWGREAGGRHVSGIGVLGLMMMQGEYQEEMLY